MPIGESTLEQVNEKPLNATVTNPYLDARREWNERYGDYIASAKLWRRIAFLSLSIAAIGVGGSVYMGSQSRLIPYVVQVDKLGNSVATGRATLAVKADIRVIKAQLSRWIVDTRSVFVDAAAQRTFITEAYGMMDNSSGAAETLNQYFRQNNPFERAKTEVVNVEIQSALPASGSTWFVEWKEERRNRQGELLSSQRWKAAITVNIVPPTEESKIETNPMGVYIVSYSWGLII